mmetsp:Transcript_9298/g.23508  ORF Transcript_9298/g.23508 Transcript_9298/m.23508 type:complete len:316 (-) Transcript_9298:238-1185(-)
MRRLAFSMDRRACCERSWALLAASSSSRSSSSWLVVNISFSCACSCATATSGAQTGDELSGATGGQPSAPPASWACSAATSARRRSLSATTCLAMSVVSSARKASSSLRSRAFSLRSCVASPTVSSFTTAWFFMRRARAAKPRVLSVSAASDWLALTAAISTALALPPRESCRMWVSLESRYGTCGEPCTRFMITWPSVESDLLMEEASLRRCPIAAVRAWRSLPARSTRCILAASDSCPSTSRSEPAGDACGESPPYSRYTERRCWTEMVKMAWLREECRFMAVPLVARKLMPRCSHSIISPCDWASTSRAPST